MNHTLSILYFDPLDKQFIPVDLLHIPLIQNSTGKAYSHFILKNTSKNIINDISFLIDTAGFVPSTKMVVKRGGLIPSPNEFLQTMSDTYVTNDDLKTLHPGESIGIFVTIEGTGHHVLIDLVDLALDITYRQSYIATSNMDLHFELTESRKEIADSFAINDPDYEVKDSIKDLTGTVTDGIAGEHIIGGLGYAMFSDIDDTISITQSFGTIATIFIKGIFHATDYIQQIIELGNLTIGLDALRKIYIKDASNEIKTIDTLEDVYGIHTIGISLSDSETYIIVSLDGKIITMEEVEEEASLPVLTSPSTIKIKSDGSNTINADIYDLIAYSDFKLPAFHKHVAMRL